MKLFFFLLLMTTTIFANDLQFKTTTGLQAKINFDSYPIIYQLETLHLSIETEENIEVKLFHPLLEVYSSDPEIEKTSENTYTLRNVFFIIDGLWQIQILNSSQKSIGYFELEIDQLVIDKTVTTHAIFKNDHYRGDEFYNGKPTGQACYIIIDRVVKNPKGKHCYDISWRYASNRLDVPKVELNVSSRITNYHRREYPKMKTCAMNIDGTTDGIDIYSDDTSELKNDIFNGMKKVENIEFHNFLSISTDDKLISRARIHGLKWNKEWDVDCLNLDKIN